MYLSSSCPALGSCVHGYVTEYAIGLCNWTIFVHLVISIGVIKLLFSRTIKLSHLRQSCSLFCFIFSLGTIASHC